VSVPSPGQIDGSSVAWSPDHSHLALVASLDERCPVRAAVFVVDAATGRLEQLAQGAGLSADWVSDRKLAIAGDKGVSVYSLDGGKAVAIDGASDLVVPRRTPRCTPAEPTDDPTPDTPPEEADDLVKP
jgi:hypothetical protein